MGTQPILKSVSMLHTLIVRRNTLRFTMNLMLLVMTLMWSIMDLMVMEDITSVKLMLKLLMVDTLGYSHGPKCHDKKDKQCHKIPKSQKHKECKKIVDTT